MIGVRKKGDFRVSIQDQWWFIKVKLISKNDLKLLLKAFNSCWWLYWNFFYSKSCIFLLWMDGIFRYNL